MSSGDYLAGMELRKAFGGREKLEWLSQWNNNYRNQRVILENIPIRYSHIFDNITSNKNSSLTKIYDTRTNILFHACLFDSLLQFTNCNFTNKNENIMCYITTPGSSLNISLTNWKYYNFIFNNNVRTTDLLTESNNNNNFDGNFIHIKKHYIHKSLSIYPSVAPSEEGIDTHQLGVIGILFDIVDHRINPFFEKMFEDNETLHNVMYTADHDGHEGEDQFVEDLDLSQIIPDHVTTEGYYAYKGSLTTPPCTDIVNWHAMNARGYIGKSQIEKVRQLMTKEDYAIAPN